MEDQTYASSNGTDTSSGVNNSLDPNSSPTKHEVMAGDTLWAIAEKYLGDPLRWKEIWKLTKGIKDPDVILPGQKVNLKDEDIAGLKEIKTNEKVKTNKVKADTEEKVNELKTDPSIKAGAEEKADEPKTDPRVKAAAEEKTDEPKTDAKVKAYYGILLGQIQLDTPTNFSVNEQDINLKLDDTDTHLALFFAISLAKSIGVEFSLAHLGNFSFTGDISGSKNFGSVIGEQDYLGLNVSAYYAKPFKYFDTRIHLGAAALQQKTTGTLDLIGKPDQSIDNSEFSSNLFLQLEVSKEVYKDWSVGPTISIIDTSDRIQSISIKLSRKITN
jgi:LysM repeat protein